MSSPPAAFAFLPWLRRGMATSIDRIDGTGAPAPWATSQVVVNLNNQSLSATVPLKLAGPGEVAGLDPRAVIRVWPRPGVQDAEPNYFPLVEFDQPDLPWRYSPAKATTGDRLRPWISLIVLREDEMVSLTPASVEGILPVVTVKSADSLPLLEQSWAWAHAQVSGAKTITGVELSALLRSAPQRVVSRILVPRRLDPRVSYQAFLVPSFERGRLAGVKEKVPDNLDGTAPAWSAGQTSIRLPVYYQWRFQTGVSGDFESLVRQLQARVLPETVGICAMDVSNPGQGLPAAHTGPLGLEGALRAPSVIPTAWTGAQRTTFQTSLTQLLNRPEDLLSSLGGTRVVAPPLYGRWHAARSTLVPVTPPVPQAVPWFQELNLDPRHRVAAGLGTLTIQDQQQQLMASAWQQLDKIRAINDQLRFAQLARETAIRIHTRHVATAGEDAFMQLTAPVHARVRQGEVTVHKTIAGSVVGGGVLQGQFRRVSRPFGPVSRRVSREPRRQPGDVLVRMNVGKLSAASPPPVPASMATPSRIGDNVPDWNNAEWSRRLLRGRLPDPRQNAFRSAALELFGDLVARPADGPVVHSVNLAQTRQTLMAELDPRVTVVESIRKRLRLRPGLRWQPRDPLEPIMAAPEFPQPMSQPLAELSQDWLLPGLDKVPPNTVSLLETNQAFIEAFMVGLNHEFARELLWNEYPTDQRGSCFRQFWNVAGRIDPSGGTPDAELLKDIHPIHGWPKLGPLGSNSPRPAGTSSPLVLLVRGDLLRRYPNAVVYAVNAQLGTDGRRNLGTEERHPLFTGRLDPDVSFFGFKLKVDEAKGTDGGQGWFFVLQEQPSEPRFGLDVASSAFGDPLGAWRDLSWGHLAADSAGLAGLSHVNLDAQLPDTRVVVPLSGDPAVVWHGGSGLGAAGTKASDLAFITLQRPVRVAIHGSQMLP
ncbi:MAG: hypothetical protein ACAI34_11375 [Verrucomicrobium sp.]